MMLQAHISIAEAKSWCNNVGDNDVVSLGAREQLGCDANTDGCQSYIHGASNLPGDLTLQEYVIAQVAQALLVSLI